MLATDFIRYNNQLIDTPFAYKQEDNLLYIAHDKEGAYTDDDNDNDINNGMCRIFFNAKPEDCCIINLSRLYDREEFLHAVFKLYSIVALWFFDKKFAHLTFSK